MFVRLFRYLAIALVLATGAQTWALTAGAAECDITPDVVQFKVPMAGYGARMGKPSTGVHDPIRAKVLVLKSDSARVAIITTDLRSVTPELKAKIIERSGDPNFNDSNVLICASHTHSGPSIFAEKFWQIQFGKHDPQIVDIMAEQIASALKVAASESHLKPVSVGIGSKRIDGFTNNRRWEYDEAARKTAGEIPATNPILTVMRFDMPAAKRDASCLALFVNFATHPTILGADNMLISAEWPGVLQGKLDSDKHVGCAVSLFANGAEGDQSPAAMSDPDSFKRMEEFGKRVEREVVGVFETIKGENVTELASVLVQPDLPEIVFSEGAKNGPNKMMAQAALDALPRKAVIQVIRIGDIALIGLPGEPICEVGIETCRKVEAAGAKQTILIGLANDYVGYIVNDREYAHGGYEVDSRSYYGPGLGAFMADQAGIAAKELFGN